MIVRDFQKEDRVAVEEIYALYWTDKEFLKELSGELSLQPKEGCRFFVAEENSEIIGIAGFKNAPDYLRQYAKTSVPVEFHILAAKYKKRGIGKTLRLKMTEEAKKLGYSEILLYSPDTHKDSWGFHDGLGERVGVATAPDGYPGHVWRISL